MKNVVPWALAFFACLGSALVASKWSGEAGAALAGYNLLGLACYGLDKWRALAGGTRIPELVLHLLALTGGSAGCALGRALLNHKTANPFFGMTQLVGASITMLAFGV